MKSKHNQEDYEAYSVINTQFRVRKIGGVRYVEKWIRPNVKLPLSTIQIKAFVDEYIHEIRSARIPLPVISDSYEEEDRLIYRCRYEGPNIIEFYTVDELGNGHGQRPLEQAIDVLSLAHDRGVFLDPHPKNFVWNGERIHYVDFSPPYTNEFMELRISLAEGEEKEIVEENFSYFGPEYIFSHFAGDFYNVDPNLDEAFLRKLHHKLSSKNYISTGYSEFVIQAKRIRELEDLRLRKGIYLF